MDISSPALLIDKPSGTLSQDMTGFNVLFVHKSIDDMGLSAAAFRVYAHLARRSNASRHCWPGIRETASVCRLSKTTVIEALKEIERRGMIVITKRQGEGNDYFLTDYEAWIQKHETRKCTRLGNASRKTALIKKPRGTVPNKGTVNTVPEEGTVCTSLGNGTGPECGTKLDPLNCNHELDPCCSEDFELLGEEVLKSAPKPKRKNKNLSKEELIDHLQKLFPEVDVASEYRKASAWILVRPYKKFTQRFFGGWVSRAYGENSILPIEKPARRTLCTT